MDTQRTHTVHMHLHVCSRKRTTKSLTSSLNPSVLCSSPSNLSHLQIDYKQLYFLYRYAWMSWCVCVRFVDSVIKIKRVSESTNVWVFWLVVSFVLIHVIRETETTTTTIVIHTHILNNVDSVKQFRFVFGPFTNSAIGRFLKNAPIRSFILRLPIISLNTNLIAWMLLSLLLPFVGYCYCCYCWWHHHRRRRHRCFCCCCCCVANADCVRILYDTVSRVKATETAAAVATAPMPTLTLPVFSYCLVCISRKHVYIYTIAIYNVNRLSVVREIL